jgi:hypothetical protein
MRQPNRLRRRRLEMHFHAPGIGIVETAMRECCGPEIAA